MAQLNFGNSTLDALACSCWVTKQCGGVHRVSVWMGLHALTVLWSSSKQWQLMKIWRCMTCLYTQASLGHPLAGALTHQPSSCLLVTVFQEEQVRPVAHPAAPLLQYLLQSHWPWNHMATSASKESRTQHGVK